MRVLPPFALVVASMAVVSSAAAYRLARRAVLQREPIPGGGLRAHVTEGHARRTIGADLRDYALRIELHNDSAAVLHVTAVRLRVTYLTRANFLGAVDLDPTRDERPEDGSTLPEPATAARHRGDEARSPTVHDRADVVRFPLALATGQAADGWLLFSTSNVIPRHCRVDDYTLILLCADGRRMKVDAALPALLQADTDGTGPATWGWD